MLRIGHGYDVHQLVEGRRCIIGGVNIPHDRGLLGHSDADVLAHALADAILGACRGGDIGKLFPDTDPAYEGADSLVLLSRVMEYARERGYEFVDADCTLACQEPKITPYRSAHKGDEVSVTTHLELQTYTKAGETVRDLKVIADDIWMREGKSVRDARLAKRLSDAEAQNKALQGGAPAAPAAPVAQAAPVQAQAPVAVAAGVDEQLPFQG